MSETKQPAVAGPVQRRVSRHAPVVVAYGGGTNTTEAGARCMP